jgi:hypothetical protein
MANREQISARPLCAGSSTRRSGLIDATLLAGSNQADPPPCCCKPFGFGEAIREVDLIDRLPGHLLAEPAGPGKLDEVDLILLAEVARILQQARQGAVG